MGLDELAERGQDGDHILIALWRSKYSHEPGSRFGVPFDVLEIGRDSRIPSSALF